jgi:hypothetical protein
MEKNSYSKKYNQLETHNNHLMETLSLIENEKEEACRTNQSLQLIVSAQRFSLPPQRKSILEQDGIKCFDMDAMQSEAQDDLRMSLGAMPPPDSKGPELLVMLEKSRMDYENLRVLKEKEERSK